MSEETTDLVARAKAALEVVTPGPWMYRALGEIWTESGMAVAAVKVHKADALFIAASRELVPELVAEVERLRMHVANEELVNAALAEKLNEAIAGVASVFDDDVREAMAQSGAETIP